jgi:hypothetical protein
MKQFKSKVLRQSDEFQENYTNMLQLVEELNKKLKDSQFEGRESTINRHHSQGKLLARERIEMLLDPDSPFLELMPLADCDKPDSQPTSIAGIGLVWSVSRPFFPRKLTPTHWCATKSQTNSANADTKILTPLKFLVFPLVGLPESVCIFSFYSF